MRWFREHRFALRDALARVLRMPGSFGFNVLVIALALILPVAGLTVLENVRPVSRELAVEPEISVFLSTDVGREQALAMGAELRKAALAGGLKAKLVFVSREEALAMMKERAGLSDVVATLGANPLPDAYVLKLANADDANDASSTERIEKLAAIIARVPGVDAVQLDAAWVKRLAALLQLAGNVLWMLAATLCGVVVAVVFNTIRLQVVTQHEEVNVSRLVGATDAFVSRPFYYTGALLGLGAGGLALLGVLLGLHVLNGPVSDLAGLYGSTFRLLPLDTASMALLLGASTTLGLLGAMLSVRYALGRAE
jgi:cell division transport system permease protein